MKLEDASHLVRLAVVLLGGVFAFVALRWMAVPADFGKLGHYRPQAIDENRKQPPAHAGRQACVACHDDVAKAGAHAQVGCESCHGPLAKHAEDPAAAAPVKPDAVRLCARCHEADAAKPHGFPQVVTREHMGGAACGGCHQPHHPKIQSERGAR
jgi:hypothetical protein